MRVWTFVVAALVGLAVTQTASAQSDSGTGLVDAAFLDRPVTLEAGKLEINARLFHFRFDVAGFSANTTGLLFGAAYGITNQLEVGVDTGLSLDPEFDWGEFITPSAIFLVSDTDQMDIGVAVAAPLSFAEGADPLNFIGIGAPVRFAVNQQLGLFFGHGLLGVGIGDLSYIDIDLNLGVSYQAMPNLALRIDTQIASIAASGDFNETTTLGDFIPFTLTGVFAVSPMIDAFASLGFPDLGSAGDSMFINAGVLIRP
jgi:hypothetical protein